MRICRSCGKTSVDVPFRTRKSRGCYDTICVECDRIRNREYHTKNRDRILARKKKWRENNKERSRVYYSRQGDLQKYARTTAYNTIRYGKIRRGTCAICGKDGAHMHHIDYSKPYLIVWLCQSHHQQVHSNSLVVEVSMITDISNCGK